MFSGLQVLKNIGDIDISEDQLPPASSPDIAEASTEGLIPIPDKNGKPPVDAGEVASESSGPQNKFRMVVAEDGSRVVDIYIYMDCCRNWSQFFAKIIATLHMATSKDTINIHLGYYLRDVDLFETISLVTAIRLSSANVSMFVANIDTISKLVLLLVCNKPVLSIAQRCKLKDIDEISYGGSNLDFKVSADVNCQLKCTLYSIILTSGMMSKAEIDNLVCENGLFAAFGPTLVERIAQANSVLKDKATEKQIYALPAE